MTTEAPAGRIAPPSAWPVALRSATLAGLGFTLALSQVQEQNLFWRSMAYVWPVLVAMGSYVFYVQRMRSVEQATLVRLFKGALLVCLLTGLSCALVNMGWYRWWHPEAMDLRLAEVSRQMAEDGYSPGDIREHLERYQRMAFGLPGVFAGTLLWTLVAALPCALIAIVQRQ